MILIVVPEHQCPKMLSRSTRFCESTDYELFPQRALHLEPVVAATCDIGASQAFRNNALEFELRRLSKKLGTFSNYVVAEFHGERTCLWHNPPQDCLSLLNGSIRDVVAVQE